MVQSSPRHYPFLDEKFPDHPYADLFPLIQEDELEQLAKSIQSDGQINPCAIYQGKILDGRNRYRAIALINSRLGDGESPIELKYGNFLDGQEGPQADYLALKLVESTNLHRRNLTTSQRAAIALSIEEFYAEIAKEERKLCLEREKGLEPESSFVNSQKPIHAAKEAAIASGIGQQSISRAKAIKKADPELFQEVLTGEKTINAAYNEIKPVKVIQPVITPIPDDSEALSQGITDDFIYDCEFITPAHIILCLNAIAKHHLETLKEWSQARYELS